MLRTMIATLALAALATAQVDYQFTMQFTGSCEADPSGATAYCYAKGPSQTMRSLISTDDAVEFDVSTVIGAYATIENDVVFYPNMTFSETGNLTFGIHQSRDHTLYYSSYGASGRMQHFVEMGSQFAFAMTAYITGGDGVFEGATGMITYQGFGEDDLSDSTKYVTLICSKPLNGTKTH